MSLQDIMNAPVCIECVQMLEHHRKDIISVNEDAVEFKKEVSIVSIFVVII